MTANKQSASQFISALVKNLQAVCHCHVEFDQNVKVVGHLFLTVDSSTEFNYIVNEKVSKSDESSTTFVSKSFYATDPQQKTPKKNLDRPHLYSTHSDDSFDVPNESERKNKAQQYSLHQSSSPQRRKHQDNVPIHQMTKRPRTSSRTSMEGLHDVTSISSVPSATPVESLPGLNESKVEFNTIKIESVAGQTVSFVTEASSGKDNEEVSSYSGSINTDRPADQPEDDPSAEPASASRSGSPTDSTEDNVIEIDVSNLKEEADNELDGLDDSKSMISPSYSQVDPGETEAGAGTELFSNLPEQAVGIYPLRLHVNEANSQSLNSDLNTEEISSTPHTRLRSTPVRAASMSSTSNAMVVDVPQFQEDLPKRIGVKVNALAEEDVHRLTGMHFIEEVPPTGKKSRAQKRCKVCYKKGLRKDVRYQCSVCPSKPGLHSGECFRVYHKKVKYWE